MVITAPERVEPWIFNEGIILFMVGSYVLYAQLQYGFLNKLYREYNKCMDFLLTPIFNFMVFLLVKYYYKVEIIRQPYEYPTPRPFAPPAQPYGRPDAIQGEWYTPDRITPTPFMYEQEILGDYDRL